MDRFLNISYLLPALFLMTALLYLRCRTTSQPLVTAYHGTLLLFTFFMTVIFTLTGVTPMSGFHPDVRWEEVNFVPFRELAAILQHGSPQFIFENVAGNVLMFAPIGFLAPLVCPKRFHFMKTVLYGFCISLLIECTQLFLLRGTDVDDLLLNTAGTALGYGALAIFCRLFPSIHTAVTKDVPKTGSLLLLNASVVISYLVIILIGFWMRFLF